LRNKLIIALALTCALGFGSISIANAQCGDMGGSMSKMHKHGKKRRARKHRRGSHKAKASSTPTPANGNQ
jgi:hypothetical protein